MFYCSHKLAVPNAGYTDHCSCSSLRRSRLRDLNMQKKLTYYKHPMNNETEFFTIMQNSFEIVSSVTKIFCAYFRFLSYLCNLWWLVRLTVQLWCWRNPSGSLSCCLCQQIPCNLEIPRGRTPYSATSLRSTDFLAHQLCTELPRKIY